MSTAARRGRKAEVDARNVREMSSSQRGRCRHPAIAPAGLGRPGRPVGTGKTKGTRDRRKAYQPVERKHWMATRPTFSAGKARPRTAGPRGFNRLPIHAARLQSPRTTKPRPGQMPTSPANMIASRQIIRAKPANMMGRSPARPSNRSSSPPPQGTAGLTPNGTQTANSPLPEDELTAEVGTFAGQPPAYALRSARAN